MANIKRDKKYFFVYKTTNLVNGKFYIGMHSTNNLKDGYLGSGKYLWYSIRKHGRENFKCEILEFCESWERLIEKEKEIITEEVLRDPLCMNLKPGGMGGWLPEHQIKGAQAGADKRKKLKETDEQWVKKISLAHSNGAKKAHREGRLKTWAQTYSWRGKHHSEATKRLKSLIAKGKKTGSENPSFGTCWVYNNKYKRNKRIKKEELDKYISKGWLKGRKRKYYKN